MKGIDRLPENSLLYLARRGFGFFKSISYDNYLHGVRASETFYDYIKMLDVGLAKREMAEAVLGLDASAEPLAGKIKEVEAAIAAYDASVGQLKRSILSYREYVGNLAMQNPLRTDVSIYPNPLELGSNAKIETNMPIAARIALVDAKDGSIVGLKRQELLRGANEIPIGDLVANRPEGQYLLNVMFERRNNYFGKIDLAELEGYVEWLVEAFMVKLPENNVSVNVRVQN